MEIDYCPTCRGVWLDRGELDTIMERSNEMAPGARSASRDNARDDHRDADHGHDDHSGHDAGAKKKRGGLLGDLLGGLSGD